MDEQLNQQQTPILLRVYEDVGGSIEDWADTTAVSIPVYLQSADISVAAMAYVIACQQSESATC